MNTGASSINKQQLNSSRAPIMQKRDAGVFTIKSDGAFNDPVDVTFADYSMSVNHISFNFYDFYAFTRAIGESMTQSWQGNGESTMSRHIKEWGTRKAASFAGKAIHSEWQKHLKTVDPDVLNFHRAMFTANFRQRPEDGLYPEMSPEIYENHYLVKDVINNRAAAIVLGNLDEIVRKHCRIIGAPNSVAHEIVSRLVTDKWDFWPALLSDLAQPYTSLTRTLSNLPGRIPGNLLVELANIHLKRPITNRRELIATLLCSQQKVGNLYVELNNIVQDATSEQIKKAMGLLSEHLHGKMNPDKATDVKNWIQFITDYPGEHGGSVVGLTKKAIRWHVHEQEQERERIIAKYDGNQRLAMPPVELPTDRRVTFLATIDDLCAEKQLMEHCIISYAEQAMRGQCYLFHVEHKGEHATVEVLPDGTVEQAQGPGNMTNKAAQAGKRILNKWGKTIPAEGEPIIYPMLKQEIVPQQRPAIDPEQIYLHMPSPFLNGTIIQPQSLAHTPLIRINNNSPFSDKAKANYPDTAMLQACANEINEHLSKAQQGMPFMNDAENYPLPVPAHPPALKRYIAEIYQIEATDIDLLKIDVPFN